MVESKSPKLYLPVPFKDYAKARKQSILADKKKISSPRTTPLKKDPDWDEHPRTKKNSTSLTARFQQRIAKILHIGNQ